MEEERCVRVFHTCRVNCHSVVISQTMSRKHESMKSLSTYVPLTALLIYDSLVAKKNNTDDDSSTHGS